MNRLTGQFFDSPTGVFNQAQVTATVEGSDFSRHGLVKRAIASGEILNIRRGLYCLAPRYQRNPINSLSLAQHIYGPSYISLESALSYHGWIPEAVHTCTSVSFGNGKEFKTPLGVFSYQRVPQGDFLHDVERRVGRNGDVFLMASAAKALADHVYVRRLNWTTLEKLADSLRIDWSNLMGVDPDQLVGLARNYRNGRVRRLLAAWQEVTS